MRLPGALLILSFALAAQTIEPPVVKIQVEPRYPDDLKFYITDHPLVKLTIDEKGEPFAIESPIRLPDNVIKAIRQSRFEPAHQGKTAKALDRELMEELGADSYLKKPSEFDEFMKLGDVVRNVFLRDAN